MSSLTNFCHLRRHLLHRLSTTNINNLRSLRHSAPCHAKLVSSSAEAVAEIPDGARIMIGGFGLCGIPENSLRTLAGLHRKDLTIIAGTGGIDGKALGLLLASNSVRRVVASYVGENKLLEKNFWTGKLEIEFVPQGTLAERIRARAAGIPAFYTPTGYGTQIHLGGAPLRHDANGAVVEVSPPKEERTFATKKYVLEEAIQADYGLIKAWKADKLGNIVFRKTANNFNEPMCKAADRSIVEVEEIVDVGQLDPDAIHVPSVYVHSFYKGESWERLIERVKVKEEKKTEVASAAGEAPGESSRIRIAKRAALEVADGTYVNLGIGIPVLVSSFIPPNVKVTFHSENGLLGMGGYPTKDQLDPDLTNAAKESITALPGASYFASDESFAIIRGGHLAVTMLGAMQVTKIAFIFKHLLTNWYFIFHLYLIRYLNTAILPTG